MWDHVTHQFSLSPVAGYSRPGVRPAFAVSAANVNGGW
jgi:hypothetical protein